MVQVIQRGDLLAEALREAAVVYSVRTPADIERVSSDYPWIGDWYEGFAAQHDRFPPSDEKLVAHLHETYV